MLRTVPAVALLGAALLVPTTSIAAPDAATATATDAAGTDAPSAARLDELMRVTRLGPQSRKVAESTVEGVVRGMAQQAGAVPAELMDEIAAAAAASFSADRFESAVASHVSGTISAHGARLLIERARTPLWQRALDGEDARNVSDDPRGFAEFAARSSGDPDAKERLGIVATLVDEYGGAEAFGGLMVDTQKAMVHGAAMANPHVGRGELDAMLETIEDGRGAVTAQMGQFMPLALAWAYEELSTKELHTLARHARTPESRRLNGAVLEGLREAMVLGSLEFADRVARATRAAEATARI